MHSTKCGVLVSVPAVCCGSEMVLVTVLKLLQICGSAKSGPRAFRASLNNKQSPFVSLGK